MSDFTELNTGIVRIVAGDLWNPNTKDAEGRPLVVKNGPNAGQPRQEWYIAAAVSKQDPEWPRIQATIYGKAAADFPDMFDASGNCLRP